MKFNMVGFFRHANKKSKMVLIIIICLTFFYRIFILTQSSLTFYSDDAIYASLARLLTQGKVYQFFHPTWPPLYPFVSTLMYPFFQNWETALRFVSIGAGVLTLIPLYALVKTLTNKYNALIFVTVIGFTEPFFRLSLFPFSDMMSTLLVISGVSLVVVGLTKKNNPQLATSSAVFGLAYLTRSEGSMFFILSYFVIFVYCLVETLKRRSKISGYIKLLVACPVLFLIIISPYLVATKSQLGTWTISHKASAQIKQWHSFEIREDTGLTWSQEVVSVKFPNHTSEYFSGGLAHVLEYQDWFWFLFKQRLANWRTVAFNNFPSWAFVVSGVGVLNIFRKKYFWAIFYLLTVFVAGILTTIFATPIADTRYLLWAALLISVAFYLGVDTIFSLLFQKSKHSKFVSAILTTGLIMYFPIFSGVETLKPRVYSQEFTKLYKRPEIEDAGTWIKENSAVENPKIMMRHEGVEFYADGQTIYTPQDLKIDEVIKYAKDLNTNYLVAWSEEVQGDKYLSWLIEQNIEHPGLTEKHRENINGRTIVVYSIY